MVSVIIPTYNRYTLLCEAVRSVLDQTFLDLEILIIDDGSSEDIEQITTLSPLIKYLRIAHWGMPGYVRNRGVENSTGEYLAFLDSDDLWYPNKLERQLAYMAGISPSPLIYTKERWLRDEKVIRQRKFRQGEGDIFDLALKRCMVGPSTVLMRRDLFLTYGGFREDLEIAEDYELWLRLTAMHKIGFIDEPLITKRAGHGDQLSEKYGYIELFRIRALQELVDKDWFSVHATDSHQSRATAELVRKFEICASGAKKRGLEDEYHVYQRMYERYHQMSLNRS